MSQFYSNTYEKFLYEKTEEYRKNWRDSVEKERQLYKLQLEQFKAN